MSSLRNQPFDAQRPLLFDSTPTSVKSDAEKRIAETIATWDSIVSEVPVEEATFENTIMPIFNDENRKLQAQRFLSFYASTSPSKELRDASSAVGRLFNDAEIELYSRKDMFLRVDAVKQQLDRQSGTPLDEESLYYFQKLHRLFYQNGCGIPDEGQRDEFKAKMKRLGDLVRQCNKNLNEDSSGIWLEPGELEGMPQSLIGRLKRGEGDQCDQLWLPTKVPFSSPAITNAKSEATRKRIYYAVQNRMNMNVPLFREILLLRDATARMLGYRDHASLKTADKMMQTPQAVGALLSDIREAVAPLAAQDVEELLKIKKDEAESRGTSAEELYFWDLSYYSTRRSEKERQQSGSVSEYFELNTTLKKLLDMFEQLFGAQFRRVDTRGPDGVDDALVWHEDVQMYAVWNVDDPEEFLGYAYLDFFPRDGKNSHAGTYALQYGYEKADGSRFYPSSALVMNYQRPTDTRPTLLSLNEVRKLFHELGHVLHALFTRARYAALNRVDRDFVEAPSMMLEQFFWAERHIKDVSFHYSHIDPSMKEQWRLTTQADGDGSQDVPETPPVQLDDDQVRNLAQTNQHKAVQDQLKELFFATYDMLVHTPSSHAELEELNLTELFNKTRSGVYKVRGGEALGEGWEWCHGQTIFRNILNRYDAGYYSYILGRVFALDIFDTGFKQDTTNREAGRRYRDMVFRVGGRQAEMKTLTDYLGHMPSIQPYLTWLQNTRSGSRPVNVGGGV